MYWSSFFIIQILNTIYASLDCTTLTATAISSSAYKTDGVIQFSFTLTGTDNIVLTFPLIWTGSPNLSPLISGTTICKETTQTITCNLSSQSFTCASLTAGSKVIKCSTIQGPHTNIPVGDFTITSSSSTCSNIQVSNFQPYGGALTFSSDQTSGLYPNSASIQMIWDNIVLPIAFNVNPRIEVELLTNAYFNVSDTIVGYASSKTIMALQSITISNSSFIKAQIPLSIASKDTAIKLNLQYIYILGNSQPITSLINFKDSNDILYYQLLFPSLTVQTGTLSAQLTLQSTQINIYTKYTFLITIANALSSSGFVRLAISSNKLSSTIQCYCDQNLATIVDISASYIDVGGCLTTIGQHTIIIQNILNPASVVSTISISTIQTMQNSYSVDLLTGFVYSTPAFTPGTLQITYTRYGDTMDIVGGLSYFNLTITPLNAINSGTVVMEIPTSIAFITQSIETCKSDIYDCTISEVALQRLTFQFSSNIIANQQFLLYQITIPIRNPYDTSSTTNFKFTSYDQFGNNIDTISSIVGYNVNTGSQFDGLILIESDQNFTNGQSQKFIFTLTTNTIQFLPLTLTITTGDLYVNNNIQCVLNGATLSSCTKTSTNSFDVILSGTSQLNAQTTLQLNVSTIQCKDTMTQSTQFTFQTKSSNGIMSYQVGPSIINIQSGSITTQTLIVDKPYFGITNAIYQFNFALSNYLLSSDYYINILCPFDLTTSDYSCKDTSNNKLDCTVQSTNIIQITGPFEINILDFNIIISGIPTPANEQQARTFTIKTYKIISNVSYLIDTSTNGAFIFNPSCPALNNCKTCTIIDTTNIQCLSCYSISVQENVYLKNSICVDQCGDGYYQNDINYNCLACSDNCKTCNYVDGNLTCSVCLDTYKYQSGLCFSTCQDTYYLKLPTDTICSSCDSECLQCSVTSSYCQKCQPNIPYYNNKCYVDGCDRGYYSTYDSTNQLICEQCPISCQSCSAETLCDECQTGLYFLSGSCLDTCPLQYYANTSDITCQSCISGCDYCSNSTQCVKCSTGFYLKNNICVTSCEDQYYVDSTGTTCQQCESKCQNCELSNETLLCNKCLTQYYFSNFECYETCPSNYYAENSQCIQCSTNCLTCSTTYKNCTSCQLTGAVPLYLDGTICVETCSAKYYGDITTGKCLSCSSNCNECTSSTNCTSCNIETTIYYLVEGVCKNECPSNYKTNGLVCELITSTEQLGPTKYVPVPYTILMCFLIISVLVSKIQKNDTFIPGAILGLTNLFVWASWLTLVGLIARYQYSFKIYQFWLLVASILFNYIINITHFVLVKYKIMIDLDFKRWLQSELKNKIVNYTTLLLSLVISFPIYKIIMCRYFGFSFFKAKMVNISEFFYFNCLNGVACLFVYIPIIIACILICYSENTTDSQIFISSIDTIIVCIFSIIFLIWETQKQESFFDEFVSNFYLNDSRPHIEKQEISGFFINPFEQKSQNEQRVDFTDLDPKQVNQENDVTKQKSNQSNEQSANLSKDGISVILSDQNSNHLFENSNRSGQFPVQNKVQQSQHQKHTVFYSVTQQITNDNPDAEPPQASPGSEYFSSVKSQISQHGEQSFQNKSHSNLKDISQIEDSQEPHENSQLSIFDEEKNQSPCKSVKALQQSKLEEIPPQVQRYEIVVQNNQNEIIDDQWNDENNPVIINEQISQLDKNTFVKKKSEQSILSKQEISNNNKQSKEQLSQSYISIKDKESPQKFQNNNQLIQSAHFLMNKTPGNKIQLMQSQSHNSINNNQSTPQLKIIANSQGHLLPTFNQSVENLCNQTNSQETNPLEQIPVHQFNNCPSIPSSQFQPKQKKNNEIAYIQDNGSLDLKMDLENIDQQPQFDQEDQKSNPILIDATLIEDQDSQFDEQQVVFQNINSQIKNQIYQEKLSKKNQKTKTEPVKQIKKQHIPEIEQDIDQSDAQHPLSDQEWGENQISPSDFNSLNQRFDDEIQNFSIETLPVKSQTQQNIGIKSAKVKPLEIEFQDDDDQDQQSFQGQAKVDFTQNYQQKKEAKKKELEKIYLQRLDKGTKQQRIQSEFKKKQNSFNHPKDLSDAYVDHQVDVEDIDF